MKLWGQLSLEDKPLGFTTLKWGTTVTGNPVRLSGTAWHAACSLLGLAWGGVAVPGLSRNQQGLSSSALYGLTKADIQGEIHVHQCLATLAISSACGMS